MSVHFPKQPELQQQLWDRLAGLGRSFEAFPFLLLSVHNCSLVPMKDDLNVWKGAPPVVESQAIKEARTAEVRFVSRLGLLDACRHIYDDVDNEVAVGATCRHPQIDRVLLWSSYGALLGGAFRMGVGKSDDQAVAVRLVPECNMGGPRRWRLPAHYLEHAEFKHGVQRIMGEVSTLWGVDVSDYMLDRVHLLLNVHATASQLLHVRSSQESSAYTFHVLLVPRVAGGSG